MFWQATAFNQPIGSWDTSQVWTMNSMFWGATAFDQPLGAWNTTGVASMAGMFRGASSLSVTSYDDLLIGWSQRSQKRDVLLDAPTAYYSPAGAAGRAILTGPGDRWTINDAGPMVAPGIGSVAVTGTAAVGSTLAAQVTGVTGAPTPTLSYQWQTSSTGAGGWVDLPTATAVSYMVANAQLGQFLRVVVTATSAPAPAVVMASAPTDVVVKAPPTAPGSVIATPGDTQVVVTWAAPASDGGSQVTGYTATADPGGRTCTTGGALTCTVTGLINGQPYTFTVVAANIVGSSPSSAPSAAVTPRTRPGPPTGVTGTPGDASVALTWAAPASDGGSQVTGYTATADPGGRTCTTGGALTCTVTGLINGQPYTFTVVAANIVGSSPSSAPSAPVTPVGPAPPPPVPPVVPPPVDGTAPTAVMARPTAGVTLSSAVPVSWSGRNIGGAVAWYQVQRAVKAPGAALGGYRNWVGARTAT